MSQYERILKMELSLSESRVPIKPVKGPEDAREAGYG
jgi:hypothetical protein